METDPEAKGNGNSYTTEFRQYDPRLGRWLSLDPLMMMFPDMSPYCAFDNNPVIYTDPMGLAASSPGDPPKKDGSIGKAIENICEILVRTLEEVVIIAKRQNYKDGRILQAKTKDKKAEWGPMKIGNTLPKPKNSNDGHCFPGSPDVKGTPSAYKSGYRVVPGTRKEWEVRTGDGRSSSDTYQSAVLLPTMRAPASKTGVLALFVLMVYTIDYVHNTPTPAFIEQITPIESEWVINESSGKNGQHANANAKAAAERAYRKALGDFQQLNSKPNKTPDDKDALEKLKKLVKHLKKKMDWGGENHSQRAKGSN